MNGERDKWYQQKSYILFLFYSAWILTFLRTEMLANGLAGFKEQGESGW